MNLPISLWIARFLTALGTRRIGGNSKPYSSRTHPSPNIIYPVITMLGKRPIPQRELAFIVHRMGVAHSSPKNVRLYYSSIVGPFNRQVFFVLFLFLESNLFDGRLSSGIMSLFASMHLV